MPFWEDDLSIFFDTDDFALSAKLGKQGIEKTINVIFDQNPEMVEGAENADIYTSIPAILAKTSDVTDVKHGEPIEINGKAYCVRYVKDLGTGISQVPLYEA